MLEKNNMNRDFSEKFQNEIENSIAMSNGFGVLLEEPLSLDDYKEMINIHYDSLIDILEESLDRIITNINESSHLEDQFPEDTIFCPALIPFNDVGYLESDDIDKVKNLIIDNDETINGFNTLGLPNRVNLILPKQSLEASFTIPKHNSVEDIRSYLIDRIIESYNKLYAIILRA